MTKLRTQIMTKLKNLIVTNTTPVATKLNCDKTEKLKLRQNSNCDRTEKLKQNQKMLTLEN